MPLSRFNIIKSIDRQIAGAIDPYIVGDTNDTLIKFVNFGTDFYQHLSIDED